MQGIKVFAGLVVLGLSVYVAEAQRQEKDCQVRGQLWSILNKKCMSLKPTQFETIAADDNGRVECRCVLLGVQECRYCVTPKTTQAPVETEAPVDTEAPNTDAPNTEAPNTEAPNTEAPNTDAPNTDAPNTDAPNTDAPNTDSPNTEVPVATDLPVGA